MWVPYAVPYKRENPDSGPVISVTKTGYLIRYVYLTQCLGKQEIAQIHIKLRMISCSSSHHIHLDNLEYENHQTQTEAISLYQGGSFITAPGTALSQIKESRHSVFARRDYFWRTEKLFAVELQGESSDNETSSSPTFIRRLKKKAKSPAACYRKRVKFAGRLEIEKLVELEQMRLNPVASNQPDAFLPSL